MERRVEEFVWQIKGGGGAVAEGRPSWAQRFTAAWENTREIVGKVWPFVVIGIAVGAGIHGYVPEDALAGILGKGAWWSVPAAVALGVPLYSNAAGTMKSHRPDTSRIEEFGEFEESTGSGAQAFQVTR